MPYKKILINTEWNPAARAVTWQYQQQERQSAQNKSDIPVNTADTQPARITRFLEFIKEFKHFMICQAELSFRNFEKNKTLNEHIAESFPPSYRIAFSALVIEPREKKLNLRN